MTNPAAPKEPAKLNSGKPWTEIDDRELRAELQQGRSLREIADLLCRTRAEVEQRIRELGLSVRFFARDRVMKVS
jgi:hypothetical protein